MKKQPHTVGAFQLDLTDEVWPVCLLKFKRELDHGGTGRYLEVRVADPDIVDSVGKILHQSGGRIVRMDKLSDCYRILIHRKDPARDEF
jgi:TusA-related sulfurtransferase